MEGEAIAKETDGRGPGLRSQLTDRIVLGGWIGLALLGQGMLPFASFGLQLFASLWLFAGIFLVRRSACLPLVLLTCPVFMCEIHRPWAWVQVVLVGLLLVRILLENRFRGRDYALMALAGGVVFFFSWPADAGQRLAELAQYAPRELVKQWIGPQAVWSMFSFRQTFDRTLIVLVCAGLLLGGGYFSAHRIWKALLVMGLMVLAVTYACTLLPWHEPHLFLGTTNFGAYRGRLFFGSGYNAHHITVLMAAALPWFFIPLKSHWGRFSLGFSVLLLPLIFARQTTFTFTAAVLFLLGLAFLAHALAGATLREKFKRRVAWSVNKRTFLPVFLACLTLAGTWFVANGLFEEKSRLRRQLDRMVSHHLPVVERHDRDGGIVEPYGVGQPHNNVHQYIAWFGPASAHAGQHGGEPASSLKKRGMERISDYSRSRAYKWPMGINHSLEHYVWKGAGAGTWAPFERDQPRPRRQYYAHMHNTYLDLVFEYGIVPMAVVFTLCGVGFVGVLFFSGGPSRLWVFYLAGVGGMAMGQHLFYTFTHMCLLIPAFLVLAKGLRPPLASVR